MIQIAIGDDASGWTIIHGLSVSAPFRSTACFFTPSSEDSVKEKLEIILSGTPGEIQTALDTLEKVRLRALQYDLGAYPYPQSLRFQQTSAISYLYTPIHDIWLEAGHKTYLTRQTGSALVILHYTRPSFFEGSYQLLTTTDIASVDHTPTINLMNHFDSGSGHSNTFLIKPTAFSSERPAPLRLQITNTYATGQLQDFLIGIYHHPTVTDHRFFYALYSDLSGGTPVASGSAIEGYYRTITWTASAFTNIYTFSISAANVHNFDGRWYRPILHLFASHAYTDLYLRLSLTLGSVTLETTDPIYAVPNYQYLVFPPLQIPPNKLLRETLPNTLNLQIEAFRTSGASATLTVDQLVLLPLDPSLMLLGFCGMSQNDTLIYDASRDLQNVRYTLAELESLSHIKKGTPLTLYPNEYNRLIILMTNTTNQIDINRTITLRALYRKRVRFA